MTDERTEGVIAEVVARYPGAIVKVALDPDPDTMRVAIFKILLDADLPRRREAEDFALALTFEKFKGEPVPYFVVSVTPATEAQYQRDVAEALGQLAKS